MFSKPQVDQILMSLLKYMQYTDEEVEQWGEDSLKFYIQMKYESNVTKGNYIREKALRVVAGIDLRLNPLFNSFC